ncbi:uncharacterized protein TNCV_1519471 [Trichonephila clavipes]|nr:uncharacterized protein TNCV_1519471 [Trichonephila clavipes]
MRSVAKSPRVAEQCDVNIHSLTQHRSTDHYGNWPVYVFFCEGFCAILFVASPHQVALQHINFCTIQSIAKLPTWSPKMMPTWLYHQHFAMFPLNRHYNVSLIFPSLVASRADLQSENTMMPPELAMLGTMWSNDEVDT